MEESKGEFLYDLCLVCLKNSRVLMARTKEYFFQDGFWIFYSEDGQKFTINADNISLIHTIHVYENDQIDENELAEKWANLLG